MFRFIRPQARNLRATLPLNVHGTSRIQARLNAQMQAGQAQNVQNVRVKKPGFRPRNVAIGLFVYYICYEAYCRVVLAPLEHAATDAVKHIPESELENSDEKPLFIPFPGTTKTIKSRPYKGTDPEWQEFIKFSKDQELAKKVRDELAEFARNIASRHPLLVLRYGKATKVRRVWLDVDFPSTPPPLYERSGIEFSDDSVSWATVPVDSLLVFKVRQALWPSALVQSMWSFTKVLATEEFKSIAGKFGIQYKSTPPPLSIEQIVTRNQQTMKNRLPSKDGPQQPIGDNKKPITEAPVSDKPTTTGSEGGIMSPTSIPAFHGHFLPAIMAFKMKLKEKWRPAPNHPPRGSIIVSGFVEVDAPKAWIVFDMKAAWDPQKKEFDARSLSVKIRRLQMKKQTPAG